MNKTKLGISTFLLAAIIYLLGLFSNTVALVVAVGYVLLREDDEWLRKSALRALILHIVLAALGYVIAFIPDIFGVVRSFLNIFGAHFSYSFVSNVQSFLGNALDIVRVVAFIILALLAFGGKGFPVPGVDGIVDKHSR